MNIKKKIAEWLGYGISPDEIQHGSQLMFIQTPNYYEMVNDPAFLPACCYPLSDIVLHGEIGRLGRFKIILSDKVRDAEG